MLKKYEGLDFDSPEMSKRASDALHQKKCLYDNYKDTYQKMLRLSHKYLGAKKDGILLELGSGGGFFKEICKDAITSDVSDVNGADMVIDAQNIPFEDNSIHTIFAVHVLHHIPDVEQFLDEVDRCCTIGGGVRYR